MSISAIIWVSALVATIIGAAVGPMASTQKTKFIAQWFTGAAVAILTLFTLVAVWQAYAPWELSSK